MADLEDAIIFLRDLNQLGGLRGVVGHRFFDEDVLALRKQLFGDVEMRRGGRDDVQRVAGGSGFGDGIENFRAMFGGDFAGGVGIGVENSGEFDVSGGGEFGVDANVMLSERAGSQNGDFDL